MVQLTAINRISIAELVLHTLFLFIAGLLAHRHGFKRNAGWLFIILFSLFHILGAALDLASTSATGETAKSLMTGAATVRNFGPAPIIMCMLSLLGKVLGVPPKKKKKGRKGKNNNTSSAHAPPPGPRAQGLIFKKNNPSNILRIVQALVMISLLLSVVAGIKHSEGLQKGSLGVVLGAFGLLVIAALAALKHVLGSGRHRGAQSTAAEASPFVAGPEAAMAAGQQYPGQYAPGQQQYQQYQSQPYDSRQSYDGAQHFSEKAVIDTPVDKERDCVSISIGVAAALPFLLIRLVYAGMGVFAEEGSERAENFRQYGSGSRSVVYLAVLAAAMDVIAAGILEGTGLVLRSRKSK